MILMNRSGHNFAHATTAQLSWHVQNCDLIYKLFFWVIAAQIWQNLYHELIDVDTARLSQQRRDIYLEVHFSKEII